MHIISGLGIKARRLEPCAVKVARTVLRGLGEPQGSPGYPAGHDRTAKKQVNGCRRRARPESWHLLGV